MEVKENNDAPVLNVEETGAGSSLIEGNNEQEQEQEAVEAVSDDSEFEVEAFDPSAFAGTNVKDEENNSSEESDDTTDGTDESDGLSWDDLNSSDTPVNTEVTPESTDEVAPESTEEKVTINNDQFKAFASELGLEAESIDEVKTVLNDLVAENKKLKEQGAEPISNKRLDDLKNFLKLDDENLVKKSLEADGLTGDRLEHTIDRLLDTGLLDVEALKIRNNVDKAIKAETNNEIKAREAEVAKQHEEHNAAVGKFNEYMQSTDSLYGFKLTGNPDKLPEVRKAHAEYVTSGTFLNEISANEQTLAESSWLWRNRETLKNALINNGRQNGRKEILDQIGVPDSSKPNRFSAPDVPGEFNPKKFMSR